MFKKTSVLYLVILVAFVLSFAGCTEPLFEVEGVESGKTYTTVTPVITAGDDVALEVTLNGANFVSGTEIKDPGDYQLVVVGDKNGEALTETYAFTISNPYAVPIGITADRQGFGFDKGTSIEVNNDAQYIKSGPRSIEYVNQPNTKSAFRIQRSPHPDWPSDWSGFERFAFWVYVEDVDPFQDTAFEMILYSPAGEKKKPWAKSELQPGWNYLEANIPEVAAPDLDKLVGMDDAPSGKGSYFMDIIVRSVDVVTVYFSDFVLWYPQP